MFFSLYEHTGHTALIEKRKIISSGFIYLLGIFFSVSGFAMSTELKIKKANGRKTSDHLTANYFCRICQSSVVSIQTMHTTPTQLVIL